MAITIEAVSMRPLQNLTEPFRKLGQVCVKARHVAAFENVYLRLARGLYKRQPERNGCEHFVRTASPSTPCTPICARMSKVA